MSQSGKAKPLGSLDRELISRVKNLPWRAAKQARITAAKAAQLRTRDIALVASIAAVILFAGGIGVGLGIGTWLGGADQNRLARAEIPEFNEPDFALDPRNTTLTHEGEKDIGALTVRVRRSERAIADLEVPKTPSGVVLREAELERTVAGEPEASSQDALQSAVIPHEHAPIPALAPPIAPPIAAPFVASEVPIAPEGGNPTSLLAGFEQPQEMRPRTQIAALPTAPQQGAGDLALSRPSINTAAEIPLWEKNAVAFSPIPGKALIAIVIDDLGIDQARTKRALELDGPLTLAFIPYGYHLQSHIDYARQAGHEALLHLPMEPMNPDIDPGPNALLTTLGHEELMQRIDWALSRFDGFVGVNNHMGSRFTAWPEGMGLVMARLKQQGLLFLDSITTQKTVAFDAARASNVPTAARDIFLDHDMRSEAVAKALRRTEIIARARGVAIAIGHPHDTTLDELKKWIPTLERKGFQLAPISALIAAREVTN